MSVINCCLFIVIFSRSLQSRVWRVWPQRDKQTSSLCLLQFLLRTTFTSTSSDRNTAAPRRRLPTDSGDECQPSTALSIYIKIHWTPWLFFLSSERPGFKKLSVPVESVLLWGSEICPSACWEPQGQSHTFHVISEITNVPAPKVLMENLTPMSGRPTDRPSIQPVGCGPTCGPERPEGTYDDYYLCLVSALLSSDLSLRSAKKVRASIFPNINLVNIPLSH